MFELCVSLTNVFIPKSVTSLGDGAFASCVSLTSATIGNRVTSLGINAFYQCFNLTGVTIGNHVNNVKDQAFLLCSNLASITIPNSVTNIGLEAFYACPRMTSITIGNGVISIGQFAFERCASLTNFTVIAGNPDFSSLNGVLFDQNQANLIQYPAGLGGNYTIPDGVTNIGPLAFDRCITLRSVTFPNSVASIGQQAFIECSGLTNLTLGNSLTTLGLQAFIGCAELTSITLPNSVTNIGSDAFLFCSGLTNITFLGNAPVLADPNEFTDDGISPTLYYYYGTTGWGATYGGLPIMGLFLPPQIGGPDGNVGVFAGNFSFTVTGVSNQIIVIQASTNFLNWQPIWTNTLSGNGTNFTDPQWTNYPCRFYRAH